MNANLMITRAALITWRDDRGASLVEYALLLALIAMVCFVAITFLGSSTSTSFSRSTSAMFP